MYNFNDRDGDEVIFNIMRDPSGEAEDSGADQADGSQFLNDSGPGMELDRREGAETSIECDDDSQLGGQPQTSQVCW